MFMFESWKILISVESFLRYFYFSSFVEVWKKKRITIYVTVYSLNEFRHVFFLMKCFFSSFFLFSSFGFKSVFLWNVLERKKVYFHASSNWRKQTATNKIFLQARIKKNRNLFFILFQGKLQRESSFGCLQTVLQIHSFPYEIECQTEFQLIKNNIFLF